ncbi:Uncharacterised protein [Chlamydia trachomatis]|nr:Uncharacterised protein [Chlamydia trachomatis]
MIERTSGKQLKTMPMQMIERWLALADISLLTQIYLLESKRAMN